MKFSQARVWKTTRSSNRSSAGHSTSAAFNALNSTIRLAPRSLRRPTKQLLPQPVPLQRAALLIGDLRAAAALAQVVEQHADGNEPSVLPAQPLHQHPEARVDPAALHIPVTEVGVHDAG